MDVGDPLSLATRVIAVKHRGHGINPQAIDVEMFEPIKSGCDQEPLHLPSPKIIDVGVPVLMEALARILVLIQSRAVKSRHAVCVSRKMSWYPINDDADIGAMAGID